MLGLRLFEFILGQIGGGQQPPPQPPEQQPPGANKICFYRDYDFAGPSLCVRMGQSDANLDGNWNDRISSIRVGRNAVVEVCEHNNYAGTCCIVSNDNRPPGQRA